MSIPNGQQKRESAPHPSASRPVEVVNLRYAGATPEDVARALLRPIRGRGMSPTKEIPAKP